MNPSAKIAVVSDLHCHAPRGGDDSSFLISKSLRNPAGTHPVEALAKLIEDKGLRADILVCPGDITDKICEQGLISGWNYLKEVKGLLNAELLATTLGNHDVNPYDKDRDDPFHIAKNFHPREFPISSHAANTDFWNEGFFLASTKNCTILAINSVTKYFNPELAKRGSVQQSLLDNLGARLNGHHLLDLRIAVVHHHPLPHESLNLGSDDLMENGEGFLTLLENYGFRLIIHGHKHHPRICYSPHSASGPTVFAAGSFSAINSAPLSSNTRNLFHIIELFDSCTDCIGPGQIRSWEFNFTRGWGEPAPRSADFPAIAGFGYRQDPTVLAAKIFDIMKNSTEQVVSWEQIGGRLPEIDFLLPRDLEKLGKASAEHYGLQLWPKPPERPEQVVRGRNQ